MQIYRRYNFITIRRHLNAYRYNLHNSVMQIHNFWRNIGFKAFILTYQ